MFLTGFVRFTCACITALMCIFIDVKIIKVCEYAALFSHGFLPSYYETLFSFLL